MHGLVELKFSTWEFKCYLQVDTIQAELDHQTVTVGYSRTGWLLEDEAFIHLLHGDWKTQESLMLAAG